MQIHEVTEGILKGVKNAAAPSRAGFTKNAAEYFANQILNKAGIPQDQQGQYDPTGHMAASTGKSTTAARQQEIQIAKQLSKEWMANKTLNGKSVLNPTANDFVEAAKLSNTASGRNLPINMNNILTDLESNGVLVPPPQSQPVNYDVPAYLRKGMSNPAASATPVVTPKAAVWRNNRNLAAPASTSPADAASNAMASRTAAPATPAVKPRSDYSGVTMNAPTYNASNIMKTVPGPSVPPPAPAATPAEQPSAIPSMVNQLVTRKPTQTKAGGTVTPTSTGLIHKAKPVARPATDPVAAAANVMAKQKAGSKVSAPLPAGAPTPAEYANLDKRLQQALAAQKRKAAA